LAGVLVEGAGVLVGVLVEGAGVLVGVFVAVGLTQMPLAQTFGSRQHSPFAQTDASGGDPPAWLLVGQQSSSP
jgi:hypothetical protein